MLPLDEEQLTARLGLQLLHGFEHGLGRWAGIGGRLPSGADVEFVCYAAMPKSVLMRADKNGNHSATVDEALQLLGLSRAEVSVSPQANG
jgi:hypothetical protein